MDGGATNNEEIDRLSTYFVLAREFGWTPAEIDQMKVTLVEDMMNFIYYVKKREQYDQKMANK